MKSLRARARPWRQVNRRHLAGAAVADAGLDHARRMRLPAKWPRGRTARRATPHSPPAHHRPNHRRQARWKHPTNPLSPQSRLTHRLLGQSVHVARAGALVARENRHHPARPMPANPRRQPWRSLRTPRHRASQLWQRRQAKRATRNPRSVRDLVEPAVADAAGARPRAKEPTLLPPMARIGRAIGRPSERPRGSRRNPRPRLRRASGKC